jgi:putative N6-adenine-specific DNA methylase
MEAEARKHAPKGIIYGSDISSESLEIAQRNIERAGLDEYIQLNCRNFADAVPPEGAGILVINPPYGERLDDPDLDAFYKLLGDTFKQKFKGYEAWVLSGNLAALKRLGLRPSKRIPLWNGAIDCRFNKYELYSGSREKGKETA